MKKVFLLLAIFALGFTSCERDVLIENQTEEDLSLLPSTEKAIKFCNYKLTTELGEVEYWYGVDEVSGRWFQYYAYENERPYGNMIGEVWDAMNDCKKGGHGNWYNN